MDCRFAGKDVGIGRYTKEIAVRLPTLFPEATFIYFVADPHAEWCQKLPANVELRHATAKPYSLAEQTTFSRMLHKEDLQLFFAPHFNIPFICSVPFVSTIHDLILHRYPNGAPVLKQFFYRKQVARAITNARKVIAVSEYTKQDLLSLRGTTLEQKIAVVPECASSAFSPRSKEEASQVLHRLNVHRPFFLYVGNAKEHKRVPMLLEAFSKLDASLPELVLVMGGKEVKRLHLPPRAHVLPSVSDDELAALYSSAVSFVSASIDEGFCLPLAEAEACGCPVIAVKAGAIPEFAGPNAMLIHDSVDALVAAFKNPPSASPLLMKKRTWEDVAKETVDVLRSSLIKH